MAREAFYKVKKSMVDRFDIEAAFLYAVLEDASRIRKKDKNGYFSLWLKYLIERTGWSKPKVLRERARLVELGLLDFIPGKNQNISGKYKML